MKRFIYILLVLVLLGIFLYSAGSLLQYYTQSRQQIRQNDALAQIVEQVREKTDAPQRSQLGGATVDPGAIQENASLVQVTDPDTAEEVTILEEYVQLYQQNGDMVGWIQIPGTVINYPVMQTPDRIDYYLYQDFYDQYSNHGSIYARESCDFNAPSDNVTIYGHNMKDGSMFADLRKYEQQSFWEEHPYIYLDTLSQRQVYEIISVFVTTVTEEGFAYHRFVDAREAGEFDDFVDTCKALSLYDTGLTAEYGDKLISLSTCIFYETDGRLVVVAKRIA